MEKYYVSFGPEPETASLAAVWAESDADALTQARAALDASGKDPDY